MLNVEPEQAVMVGDTATDMLFAKNGKFGMAIGVLSGVGKRENLEEAWFSVEVGTNDKTANPVATSQSTKFHIVHSVADILPLVLPDSSIPVRLHCNRTRVHSDYMNSGEQPLKEVEYKLVIFDKNGSLTNVHPRWSKWAEAICEKLKVRTSVTMARKFSDILGYSPDTRQAAGGMLAESSLLHIRDCLGYLLTLNGYGLKQSAQIVDEIWYTPGLGPDDLLPGVVKTIRELRRNGLRIAVNTSDGHVACESFLACSKLHDQIDMILSAEDADRYPKPLPHTVHRIMDAMSCKPEQTIVVGDTPADLISGHAAGVGLTIGVLSGFSLAHNLLPHADLLMPNVTYLPRIVQKDDN
ncbi:hypothetical protein PHET_08041 [Paragonimus heterotremus]|uniref:Uncharacterized protein n=1 Tax=Paragonimus heterotremus TaxID=100268 RepID=A0A8J4SVB0_9TREM|nr:hypothetical protein PHET_08041 [Paragonimus heterotremus]